MSCFLLKLTDMKKVFVGFSGGVDSSVAALLLKQQGYEVTGVYMKNWTQDLPGLRCPWQDDFNDAKRVAVQLGIDFKVYDFQKEYKHLVVDYMLREYKAGHTPNPDIMCNQEVKFGLFLETALDDGADLIATGHYARILRGPASQNQNAEARMQNAAKTLHSSFSIPHSVSLAMAKDTSKDQTYFLYRASSKALKKTLYPIGDYLKSEVRQLAAKHKLVTADKKESMGLCFVGKVGIKDFLSQYVEGKPGKIIDQSGKVVGQHDGAIFYTIGQRHGLEVGGGLPYYVTDKDMKQNIVYVTTDLQDEKLWSREVQLADIHWIRGEPQFPVLSSQFSVRTRHRAPLITVEKLNKLSNGKWVAVLADDVRALTPGQSSVFYSGSECLGGGVII